MHFFSKTTIALTVALAAFSDATSHGRHRYRHFNRQDSSVSVPLGTGYPTPTSTMGEAPAKKPVDTSLPGMTSVSVPTGTGSNPKPTPHDPSCTVITSVVSYTLGPGNSVTSYTYTTSVPITHETRTVIPTPVGPPSSVTPTTRTTTSTSTSTSTEWVTVTENCTSASQGAPGSAQTKAPEKPAGNPGQAPTNAPQPPAGAPGPDNTCPCPCPPPFTATVTATVTQATATVTMTVTTPTKAQEAGNHAPAVKSPDQATPQFPSLKPTHPAHPSHPSHGMPHGTGSPAYHFPTGLAY
ncbi:hypothetical protein H112_01179 [Trichophyton rubrum D6]|uniref:Uncharacterized protein n=3 Tax=Trichophyton TaxID=5550 RepID=A0A080WXL8_TRIRC|nr:uncharacterized protein TERG_07595 [Trichophyton rubrum CBS 118892]EZF26627.1 hypothetical protein H100_01172 [Trichophyton rubrum MR850]EZF45733.1 hypothetical protein H102_01169 [Trichophyton rubrum CBS 100081]EZF56307.1 hypothetical protein H103_01176 [Trichophyton rubrum CBS 288.86]EZF67054.1 hypothetical protein H104_01162 [Trichophyton rubrum CBS 289.86]EZF77703.1 hypothetical protein H105_01182 [Trichophyton soudanense CBS 452.61]EZF88235.1 hypothetical protein H110_01179 [Trichophy